MKTISSLMIVLLLLLNGIMTSSPHVQAQEVEVIAENLEIPWSIQKYEDNFYITERGGSIVEVSSGHMERQDVNLAFSLWDGGEAGLLGLLLRDDFAQSQRAYAYYTYQEGDKFANRLVVLELMDGVWNEVDIILDGIPSANIHDGGRLAIGPDRHLYVTTGDAAEPAWSQELDSLAGKILRLTLEGEIPADNPFENSYVYSYGHRNPQGLAWDAEGNLYASEHGNQSHDEINQIQIGQNYGWPLIEGLEEADGMQAPLFTSGSDYTWAPSGMAVHEGSLYVAALRGNAILVFDLASGQMEEWATNYGRIRDIYIEDGVLYFITNNTDGRGSPLENDDKLYRINLN